MMKHLPAKLIILLLLCASSKAVTAQSQEFWVDVAPAGEQFTVQLPKSPEKKAAKSSTKELSVDGRAYMAEEGGVSYTIWSLKNTNYSSAKFVDGSDYLDACADLVWDSLLKPLRDRLPKDRYTDERMTYQEELEGKPIPGREYWIRLGNTQGATNFYVVGDRIYVLAVLNTEPHSPEAERFLKSFSIPSTIQADPVLFPFGKRPDSKMGIGIGMGEGIGPGRGGAIDRGRNAGAGGGGGGGPDVIAAAKNNPNAVFSPRVVSQKARILSKREPQYTESARKYQVQGTIIIRAVFSKDGSITDIKVLKGLPHGLTQSALAATRGIRFTPALIEGRPVSQYIQLEYNFNLY